MSVIDLVGNSTLVAFGTKENMIHLQPDFMGEADLTIF
jgi:hypothetical protein